MVEVYFNKLNYSLGNEDTGLEYEISKQLNAENVFSVCGSGGRALPLVNSKTKKLVLCDLSLQQLYLAELRECSYRNLNYTEFLLLFGYFPFGKKTESIIERERIFQKLKLSSGAEKYFLSYFQNNKYESLLYDGKWEKTFKVLSKITQSILGKKAINKLFSFKNLDEQRKYLDHSFSWWRFYLILILVGNKSFFNSLLYKGHFVKKNIKESHFEFYRNSFKRLMYNTLMSESFFLSLCFYGELINESSNPIEANEDIFNSIKNSNFQTSYINQDIVTYLSKTTDKYDLLSLSDVPSYFNDELGHSFLQKITNSVNLNGVVIVRYYLRVYLPDLSGFQDVTEQFETLIQKEKVQMYDIKIYKKIC